MEELQKLDDVFQFGFITEAEYKERKRAILLEHNLPLEDDATSQDAQNSTGHENDSNSNNEFSFNSSPYAHSVPSYPSPYNAPTHDASSYNTPSYDTSYSTPSYSAPTYDTSSHNVPTTTTTYDAYDTSSYNAPYEATSYSIPSNDTPSYSTYNDTPSYAHNESPSYSTPSNDTPSYSTYNDTPSYVHNEFPHSVPSYDPPSYEDPSIMFHSVPSNATSDSIEMVDENIAPTQWNNVTPQPKQQNKSSPSFKEPSDIPPCKITRISVQPKYTNLSSLLSNSTAFSEEHYVDDTQAKVIIYLNERYGAFQFIMEPDVTLGSILKSLGITSAGLMQLDLTKKAQPLCDSQDDIPPNIILSDESQKIAPGHYKLIRNFSIFHRGRWHLKVDRQSYEFKFKPEAYSTFIHYDIIVPSTESRWQSMERFNKTRTRSDINWDKWNSYRNSLAARYKDTPSYSSPLRKTKCSFSGDLNPENSLAHFLIRLRTLESKWGKTNETLAIQKIKKSLSERVCYICGESVYTALPFCVEHSDELLSNLFSSETVAMYFAEYVAPEKEIEPIKQGKKKSTSPSEATGLYEKHMKKADQYRYSDFSGKMQNLDFRSELVARTQETLRLSLQKAAL